MWQLQLLVAIYFIAGTIQQNVNFWNSYSPGELLQRLNQLTDTIEAAPMHLRPHLATLPPPSNFATTAVKRADNDVASSEYDYDRAYEQFVRQYFGEAAQNAFSAEDVGSTEDITSLSAEELEEPLTEATKTRKRKHHCKQVRKNGQQCEVCRNPRTGEKSETCSYYTETAPHEYNYERAKNYKKSRHSEVNSDEDEDESPLAYNSAEGSNESSQETDNQRRNAGGGECIRRSRGGRLCYTCINSAGEKNEKCSRQESTRKRRRGGADKDKRNGRKSQKEQRIYKRTVSYSFENGNSTMPTNSSTTGLLHQPRLKKKIFIKVLKQNDDLK